MSSRPQMMKNYSSFDEWKEDQSAENLKLIEQLENLVKEVSPHLDTTVKWGQGCWVDGGNPKAFIHTEPDHLQFGFYNGSSLKDPHGLLLGNGKYIRFIKIYNMEDIKREPFVELIKQAVMSL